ncbi:MAG: glycosyltransferase family 4 protein [Candidatus Sericytochromatia bacterium]|nr:glycosyltransferase family 4 protein [Candidatus Sericytochromatia bacterium]
MKLLVICALDLTAWAFLRPQLQAMRARGWEVHLACSPGPRLPALAAAGIRCHPIPISRRLLDAGHVLTLARLWRLMRAERFDLVHVHTPIAAALGRVAARLAGVPRVAYTAHGFYFHDEMAPGPRRLHIALERALGRLTDAMIAVSGEDAATAVQLGILPAARVTHVPNGIDPGRFGQAPGAELAAWRARLGLPPDALVVGTMGRLVREKGFGELFEAIARLAPHHPRLHLLVVGDALASDRDPFKEALLARVDAPPLAGRVHLTGFTDAVPTVLALMDVFALPSYREGLPVSILEAMATGLPVVATDIRGCREEVVAGETGLLVPTRDAARLAEALEQLLGDPDLRARMGAAGRARVAALFDERQACDQVVAVLERLGAER